jgi:glutamine synthetase type III
MEVLREARRLPQSSSCVIRASHTARVSLPYELANISGITLSDRTYYLAQSLASAKSAVSVGADDVEFVQRIQDSMDVAVIQGEVLHAVRRVDGLDEKEKIHRELDGVLLDLDQVRLAHDALEKIPLNKDLAFH